MSNPHEREEERRREALATLKSLGESETFVTSTLAQTAERATDHFAARDAIGPDGSVDRIELWGRRIGRALSLLGLIALAVYFYLIYFAK